MENSCLEKNQLSRGSRELKIGCHRWKTAVLTKPAAQEVRRAQNRLFQIENSCFKKIRCLGGPESSKSAILDGKQLFLKKSGVQEVQRAQNRLFQIENSCLYQIRCLEGQRLKSGILDGKQVFFYYIRCLGGPQSSILAFLDGKQLLISNQVIRKSIELKIGYFNEKQLLISNTVFRRSIELELGYFRWKTAVYMKFGVFRNFLFFGPKSWFLFKKSKMATF